MAIFQHPGPGPASLLIGRLDFPDHCVVLLHHTALRRLSLLTFDDYGIMVRDYWRGKIDQKKTISMSTF